MKKIIIFSLLCLASVLAGCSESSTSEVGPGEPAGPAEVEEGYVVPSFEISRHYGVTGFNVLGRGYDITTTYADPGQIKEAVVNLDSLNKYYPEAISVGDMDDVSEGFTVQGDSPQDFCMNMGLRAGCISPTSLFAGTLDILGYSVSDLISGQYSMLMYEARFYDQQMRIKASAELLKRYAISLQAAISFRTPEEIIRIYGTHVYTTIYTGNRFQAIYAARPGLPESLLRKYAVHHLKEVFGISVPGSIEQGYVYDRNMCERISFETFGGDFLTNGRGVVVIGSQTNPKIDPFPWKKNSDDRSKMVVIDNGGDLGIPIYELVQDEAKKADLKTAVEKYIRKNTL